MASLRKRNGVYYIVFTRRVEGKLQQKAFSLGTTRKRTAEALRIGYQEQYALGDINPFNGWSPKRALEHKREAKPTGTTLEETTVGFMQSRSHTRAITQTEYRRLLNKLIERLGRTMPVGLISEQDIRDLCFKPRLSTSTQTT